MNNKAINKLHGWVESHNPPGRFLKAAIALEVSEPTLRKCLSCISYKPSPDVGEKLNKVVGLSYNDIYEVDNA